RVSAVGNKRERVLEFTARVVHSSGRTDESGNGGIDDDIAWAVQIGNPPRRVHHRQRRAVGQTAANICFDLGSHGGRKRGYFREQFAEAVVQIHVQARNRGGVFFQRRPKVNTDRVSENDRVRDPHHRRLEVQREQQSIFLSPRDCLLQKLKQRLLAQHRRVENIARQQFDVRLENRDFASLGYEFDACFRRIREGD